MNVRPLFVLIFSAMALFPTAAWADDALASEEPTAVIPHMLLGPAGKLARKDLFQKILDCRDEDSREKAKIQYLLARVKESDCEFVRNGEIHRGPRASFHLAMKYHKQPSQIKTARDFVLLLASGSRDSGKPYHIRCPGGREYLSRDVFLNELRLLNQLLIQARPAQAAAA